MNTFTAIGRLTADPKANKTKNGTDISSFMLAIPKGKDEADFLRCIAWDKTAAVINKFFKKGSRIGITGSVHSRSYTDDNDKPVYVVEVLINQVDFCDSKTAPENNKKESGSVPDLPFDIDAL